MRLRISASSILLLLPSLVVALSNLDRPRAGFLQDVLETVADQKYCKPTGLIQDACCDFETVETVNSNLFYALKDLVSTPFFRYHKVDLFKECPFWQEDGSCMNQACGVETTDEEHIPEDWRSNKLGALETKKAEESPDDLPVGCQVDDSNFCVLEDEADLDGLYVDLRQNPERFTGYAGPSSSRVWKAIYEENCFTPIPFIDPARAQSEGGTGFAPLSMGMLKSSPGGFGALSGWGESEGKLMGSLAAPRDAGDEVCLEKRVFYRLISGLHASISIHICDEYLDQKTGLWGPNLECFITRISQHPERLQNAYFTYVLMLRALSKSGPQLLATLADTSINSRTDGTKEKLQELIGVAQGCPSTFDETSMFSGPSSEILKTEFKEHFRNISRIMDCVGCDKCKLWGKLQVTGLGTGLKLLFSNDESVPSFPSSSTLPAPSSLVLSRGEVVAFVNTLHRFSESLAAVERFRMLWKQRNQKEEEEASIEARLVAEEAEKTLEPSIPVVEVLKEQESVVIEEHIPTPATESVPSAAVEDNLVIPENTASPDSTIIPSSSRSPDNSSDEDGSRGVVQRVLGLWKSCLDLASGRHSEL